MLSDDSSSDSETGRFKCRTKTQDEQSSSKKQDNVRSTGRSRYSENDRFRRDFDRKRDERDRYDKHSRDRHRYSRHSPINRRRHSRERSLNRKSHERIRHMESRGRSKPRDHRSGSRERQKTSKPHTSSRPHKSPEIKKDLKEDIKSNNIKLSEKAPDKFDRKSRDKVSSSPEFRGKRSEVYIPPPSAPLKRKSDSPIIIEDHVASDLSDEVQPGSYYSMIPAVVKEKSESSEIDSSDDEKLRAKLLNLEKELHKTRKKKHKKKHRRKSSKSSKERDTVTSVEVSSTTDIQGNIKNDLANSQAETVAEVSSTQKSTLKESSEEGEISSDNDSVDDIEIDPSDLRHKLRRSAPKTDLIPETLQPKEDVCGPALPPHLEQHFRKSVSPGTEGPALPPHLKKKPKNIGPSIPEDMRKVLADREVVEYESSDDGAVGPLPAGAEDKWSEAHQRLEERALDMKIKKLDGHSLQNYKVKSREQWMLELPEGKAKYLGLEARSFRAKEGPDMSDRSSWTDTPEEKARKAAGIPKEVDADTALKRDARARQIASRDEEQETAVKKHKKKHKREESLLEIHEKKLKKKKKKEEKEDGKKERRPFSRDVDLQVNRFDDAQKKSIIKKSQELNTRFSSGEAKYL